MSFITSYNPLPISFSHGQGAWLFDTNNKEYLDALSGIAVCGLGHAHPEVTKTIQEQAAKIIHTSNVFTIEKQLQLAEKLTRMSGMDQVFFGNSGAEANEAAIKLTRLFGHKKGIDTPSIIVMEKAFHGRTMATLTASGSRKVQAGFEPLVPGFIRAPYNSIDDIKTIAHNRSDVVAVMVEPIQGEGGINPLEENYLKELRQLCDDNDWLLILDEIQTGNARTGEMYAYMHSPIKPDILTTAKGLGNGMPIGACLMHGKACDIFQPGNHGSTFGGNPLACATAYTVLDVIEKNNLCDTVAKNSAYLFDKLSSAFANNPHVTDIRGLGYMLGVELDKPCREIMKIGLTHGLLFNVTADRVIRLLPPLIISVEEIDELVLRLSRCVEQFFD
jgi:acetylornithine/N-succinyldiaminopimelate aminotransferase